MIRFVEDRDVRRITEIYNRYITEGVETFETEPLTEERMAQRVKEIAATCPYIVYEENGVVEGYCYAHPWKERAAFANTFETTVYVAHGSGGRGIGSSLMRRLIEECRRKGCRVLVACITGCNEPSIALHKKLGFVQVSHFHNVGYKFGRWLDVVDLEMQLG